MIPTPALIKLWYNVPIDLDADGPVTYTCWCCEKEFLATFADKTRYTTLIYQCPVCDVRGGDFPTLPSVTFTAESRLFRTQKGQVWEPYVDHGDPTVHMPSPA